MRRYLTLVFMVFLAIPTGMTFSGCIRNPAGNFCNGLGYGLKNTDVYAMDLETEETTGVSLAFGQERQINAPRQPPAWAPTRVFPPTAMPPPTTSCSISLRPGTCVPVPGIATRAAAFPDFTICNPPNPLPSTNGLPYATAYISASANSVTSNPVEVYVHAQVSSVALALSGSSTGIPAVLFAGYEYPAGLRVVLCVERNAVRVLRPGRGDELLVPGGLAPGVSSVPSCSNSIGALTYAVGTTAIAGINAATNIITAQQPGATVVTASVAGSGGSAGFFTTCPPRTISVTLNGNTNATVTQGITQNLTTTVYDTNVTGCPPLGCEITGLTLDYQSTNPLDISVGTSGSVVPSFPGAASVYAICQPATCNPSPINQIGLFGSGLSISSNAVNINTPGTASSYVWFAAPGQSQYFVPYDLVGNRLGSTVRLPYVPNSMVMDKIGSTLYFGSSHALMAFSTSSDSLNGTPNTAVPGVVLAVAPNDQLILINDQVRRVFYIYNPSGSVVGTFTGVGNSAVWTPDSRTLYVTDSASLGPNHSDTLYVYNANTGWTTYDLTSSGGAANLTLTIPSVGAYLSGNPTVAHTWCPAGTATNYASMVFYPEGDSVPAQTDVLGATSDGAHVLGAAIAGGAVQLSDIWVSVPFTQGSGAVTGGSTATVNLPDACPQSGQTLEPLTINHPYPTNQVPVTGINPTALNQIVASPSSDLSFLTYTGSTPGATLPYYLPGSGGAAGTLNYVTLSGGNVVTAPVAGAFSLDNQIFFVSTSGDNLIHFINTTTLQDTQQINPALPACTPGSDPDCLITTPTTSTVPATVVIVKPRSTT